MNDYIETFKEGIATTAEAKAARALDDAKGRAKILDGVADLVFMGHLVAGFLLMSINIVIHFRMEVGVVLLVAGVLSLVAGFFWRLLIRSIANGLMSQYRTEELAIEQVNLLREMSTITKAERSENWRGD